MLQINWKIKTYLIIIFLLFGIQKDTAQILIGPTIGLNWSAFSIANLDGSTSTKSTPGLSFGAIVEFPLIPLLSIRIEPSYIEKGSDVYFSDMGGPTINKLRNQYFQIPVELKANLPLPVFSPHIFIGPTVGYLISAKQGTSRSSSIEIDVKDSYKKFDCALDFGAGFQYSIAPLIKVNLDYKYSLGLLNIDNTNFTPIHTRGNQVIVGILFSI